MFREIPGSSAENTEEVNLAQPGANKLCLALWEKLGVEMER